MSYLLCKNPLLNFNSRVSTFRKEPAKNILYRNPNYSILPISDCYLS